MGSGCMYSPSALGCVDARAPVRATYVNLYRWPESDAEFVKSVSSGELLRRRHHGHKYQYHPAQPRPRVVDSYSCRQMYLRSYTFSKKETVPERTRKCLGRVKEKVVAGVAGNGKCVPGRLPWGRGRGAGAGDRCAAGMAHSGGGRVKTKMKKKKRCLVIRRLREVSAAVLRSIFHRLLSCTAAVDVADREPS